MAVALAGETGRAALTSVTSDAQGHFSVAVQIPVDAPLGVYALEAVAESGAGLKAVLVVEGLPIVDGDGGPRGQDEPLLVVLPADWQRSLAAPVAPLPPFVAPPHQPPAVPPDGANLVPWVALVGAIPVLAILFWGLRQRRDLPDGPAELP